MFKIFTSSKKSAHFFAVRIGGTNYRHLSSGITTPGWGVSTAHLVCVRSKLQSTGGASAACKKQRNISKQKIFHGLSYIIPFFEDFTVLRWSFYCLDCFVQPCPSRHSWMNPFLLKLPQSDGLFSLNPAWCAFTRQSFLSRDQSAWVAPGLT